MSTELYRDLLGDDWWKLAEPVRRLHAARTELSGCFDIQAGANWMARCLGRWSRLPPPGSGVAVRLRIISEPASQRWERRFSNHAWTTIQRPGKGGRLLERFGIWELSFKLKVVAAELRYVQHAARLCIGSSRLPVPLIFAPRVIASEAGDGGPRVEVTVRVTLPLVGLLVAYHGHLDVPETIS